MKEQAGAAKTPRPFFGQFLRGWTDAASGITRCPYRSGSGFGEAHCRAWEAGNEAQRKGVVGIDLAYAAWRRSRR